MLGFEVSIARQGHDTLRGFHGIFRAGSLGRGLGGKIAKSTSICGSDFYLAPEVIKQEEYGREIDIWAVGVITFVVLSGALPFFNPVLHKLYRQIVERDVSFADDRWRAVSAGAQVGRKWRECSMAVWSLAHATQNLVQVPLFYLGFGSFRHCATGC
ncbi:Serine/threonine-protein kinase H1-like [Symbiodinium microadriaticum]|uniref:Serine/threonine-protein kinase H1-like n=1 Tax=Symbiodinium microadriaticum TaxID=2951 RepID=A0A1Q9BWC4_SYMMI|nr:Serine/threonine-protein kinase H1-like [Symbiodinium microadriaticum]